MDISNEEEEEDRDEQSMEMPIQTMFRTEMSKDRDSDEGYGEIAMHSCCAVIQHEQKIIENSFLIGQQTQKPLSLSQFLSD